VIRRAALLLGVPVLLAALVAVPLGSWRGSHQWLCAAVAVALVVPPGLISLILSERLAKSSPYGRVGAMVLGTVVRVAAGFGGAVVVFLAAGDTFRSDPISFWAWVLGTYLTTLLVETALLARMNSQLSDASKMRPDSA
jgi:hypothetical protein